MPSRPPKPPQTKTSTFDPKDGTPRNRAKPQPRGESITSLPLLEVKTGNRPTCVGLLFRVLTITTQAEKLRVERRFLALIS